MVYGIASRLIIDALRQVKLVFNPNALAQVAALAAMDDHEHVEKTLANNTKWISKLERLYTSRGIKFVKSYANFVCAVFPEEDEAARFFYYMDQQGFLLRKLDGFGMPESVRVSIGTEFEMQSFAEVLNAY